MEILQVRYSFKYTIREVINFDDEKKLLSETDYNIYVLSQMIRIGGIRRDSHCSRRT